MDINQFEEGLSIKSPGAAGKGCIQPAAGTGQDPWAGQADGTTCRWNTSPSSHSGENT